MIADEILIADSGATDGTVQIAQQLCENWCECTVHARDYVTACDFKNWAIGKAQHPWVLIVDVDERLTVRLAEEIQHALQLGPRCDGYRVLRHNYFLGQRVRFSGWGHDRVIRFFRSDAFRYPNNDADHGEFLTQGRSIGKLRQPMKHYARRSYAEQLEKWNRYSALQAEQWYQAGRRPSFLQMMFRPPLRFVRAYLVYGGFLDGKVGLQLAYLAAYYAFMKQARLWERWQRDESSADDDSAEVRRAA